MKRSTLEKRFNNLDLNRNTIAYKLLRYIITGRAGLYEGWMKDYYRDGKIYTLHRFGYLSWDNYISISVVVRDILSALRLDVIICVDEPLGSSLGHYLKITTEITED